MFSHLVSFLFQVRSLVQDSVTIAVVDLILLAMRLRGTLAHFRHLLAAERAFQTGDPLNYAISCRCYLLKLFRST